MSCLAKNASHTSRPKMKTTRIAESVRKIHC